MFARDGKLRAPETECRGEDLSIRGSFEMRMKLPDTLRCGWIAHGMIAEQVFGLVLEMIEIRVRRKGLYRHDELPFRCPGPHLEGRKLVRDTNCLEQVDFCPFRGPDAPICATTRLPWQLPWGTEPWGHHPGRSLQPQHRPLRGEDLFEARFG